MPRCLFSNEEMGDIVCLYAQEIFNCRKAHRYLEMYPNRPDFKIFENIYGRLGETGYFRPKHNEGGCSNTRAG